MTKNTKNILKIWFSLLGIIFISLIFLSQKTEQARVYSPNKSYIAIASSRRYQNYLLGFPGQGSDKPGYLKIIHKNGASFGEAPLDMLSAIYDISWENNGARIIASIEWDFSVKSCYYWDKKQTQQKRCF